MARPIKKGLEYFPLDTDIDQNDKIQLIEGEFGIKGFAIVIKLLCKIYKDKGYYYQWDEKERLLFAKKLGEPGGLVDEVVNRCIKWGLFNKSVFDKFKVLTSAAIQERYIKAIGRRDMVELIGDFTLIGVSAYSNVVIVDINPINADSNTQSKVKNSKEKESREATPQSPDFIKFNQWLQKHAPSVLKMKQPFTEEEFVRIKQEYDTKAITDVLESMHNKPNLVKDYTSANLTCRNWIKRRHEKDQPTAENGVSKATQDMLDALNKKNQ